MNITLRQETTSDYLKVEELISEAFKNVPYSNQTEHQLVHRLRLSQAFVPELSIIALRKNEIVGHVLMSKIIIQDLSISKAGLTLAPISVKPSLQFKGIGTMLMNAVHKKAIESNYQFSVLIGHEKYYPRFGYELAKKYNISFPFEVPEKNCMVKILNKREDTSLNGKVVYPSAFGLNQNH